MSEEHNQSQIKGSCPHCGGTGWKHISEDGLEKVKRCACYYEDRRKRLLLSARIPRRYFHCTMDQFDDNYIDRGQRPLEPAGPQVNIHMAKEAAQAFARQYPNESKGLLFMGPCGVGKTHLAVAIIRDLIERKGIPCLFYDFRDLLKEIQASYNPQSSVSEGSILEPVLKAEVLLLDELGATKVTDWMRDMLTYIINSRYNDHMATIITSNWMDDKRDDEETLEERIGTRLRSRLYEMCTVYEIVGPDYRKKNKRQF